jgi:hypothetical protein
MAKILQPTQKWVVDYRTEQCLASRDYGPADRPVTLAIRPAFDGETYELLIAREQAGPRFAIQREGSVDFGAGRVEAWVLNYAGKGPKSDIHQFRIPAANLAQARGSAAVTFRLSGAPDVTLALSSMPSVLKTLQDCTADLQRYWNFGGDKDGRITSLASGTLKGLFKASDYPAEAYWRSQGGQSRFMLLIDERGLVAGCHVLEASGIPSIDAMGCKVIRERARFQPALDNRGKPVRSTAASPPIVWRTER